MPVNYVQIENSLETYAGKVKHQQSALVPLEEALWEQFSDGSWSLSQMREKISQAESQARSLYCAKPLSEPLLTHKPAPEVPEKYTLLAADGSQIAPDRHKPIPFCVVNLGLIRVRMGSGEAPEQSVVSHLLEPEELFSSEGSLLGEDEVALHRDLAEREALLAFAPDAEQPVIALTDGPLDVYLGLRRLERRQVIQEQVRAIHRHLQDREIISAGYIDKPGSEMLSRMFAVLQVPQEKLGGYDEKQRAIRGISDARLLSRLLTQPGERSAIFEAVTKSEGSSGLKVHFFFLNAGNSAADQPYLARVEFPAWVSDFPDKVDLLHAVIYRDLQVLDTHPYPYLLQRAHELAIISMAEHTHVEEMLMRGYAQEGLATGLRSNKEVNKSYLRR